MSYVIVSDKRYGHGKQFLVDRTYCKSRWWSKYPEDAIRFTSFNVARATCADLRYNNPAVIEVGSDIYRHIAQDNFQDACERDEGPEGWDGHK